MSSEARGGEYADGYEDESGTDGGGRSFGEQLDLQHYVRILRKHKWPIALFTASITALAAYYAMTATPIYSATSTLLIEQQKANLVSIEELYGVDTENVDYYQTQFELLKSRNLAQKVIERLDLWSHPEFAAAEVPEGAEGAGTPAGADGGSVVDLVEGTLERVGLGPRADGEGASAAESAADVSVSTAPGSTAPGSTVSGPAASGSAAPGPAAPGSAASFGLEASGASEEEVQRAYIERVAQNGGYGSEPALSRAQEIVVARFLGRLSVSPVRKTKLVRISFQSADPKLAARVANTVGEQYITSYLDAKLELTSRASSWLSERLATLKERLDESEDRLIAFKQENGLVDVDGSVGRLNEQELLLLTAELAEARSELSNLQDIDREVQSLKDSPELLQNIPSIQADPLVQGVKIDQGQAQRTLDELLNRYGARHPRVVDAKSQLASLDATLQANMQRVVGSIAKDAQLARQRVATINAKLASGKQDIQVIGNKKFELDALEREVATNQNIYDQFFSRMTEASSADGLETANARISDYARPPVGPIKPNKQLIVALAALGSLGLSMLMAFLYETMDDTVTSTNDIEGRLGLKLLGILPLIKGGMFGRTRELPLDPTELPDKKGTFAESVNTIRTAISLDDVKAGRKTIMVTSSIPGEGKSTASINLAYSFAQLERVLLIDCDLRRPTIAKAAGLDKNVSGLSSLITRAAPARECIKRGLFGGAVDVLPSGPIPDQPLELLSSRRFGRLLEQLGEHYDRIVIDSAPTQAVSDALVLSKVCDGVIYVVKSHDTSRELVKRGVQRLEQVNAKIAGVVITQVDINKIVSYGGDYYYQGYYDYYGYTDDESSSRRPGKLHLTQEELISMKNDDEDFDLGLGDRSRVHRREERRPADGFDAGVEPRREGGSRDGGMRPARADADADTVVAPRRREAQPERPRRAERDAAGATTTARRRVPDDLDIL